ncbi:ATP-binding protein [Azospirillum agricola]|uniref:ATP-binding protein n=1 Tax=Azospirillum agricola TaxID=1720247 RepID=UPI000A0F1C29|nr:ATP-binding protein [Azospirillum agricola]SMH39433.1 His Kinase A (phospho-acceptor) domain-containing protein [Azospirillum lipoferum]
MAADGSILILAPYGRDAEVIGLVLGEAGLAVRRCADVAAVCATPTEAAAALVLAEAALMDGGLERLAGWLAGQPSWSDLPVLVLTARGQQPAGKGRWDLFQRLGNVTLLDRPLQAEALRSAARSAQRSRMRQYRSRMHLEDIARSAEVLEQRVAERSQALVTEMAERRRAQEALHQAQKMEAIGQLTGGMAHDFNNVLQGIAGCLAVLDRHVPDGAPRALFEAASRSIQRGAHLTQSLLAFARRQTLMPQATDLHDLLDGMRPLLERSLGGLIRVVILVSPDTPAALVDRAQLESAILNLVINARDAMPSGGQLTLSAFGATSDAWLPDSGEPPAIPPGVHVAVRVEDTGTGMDEATLARVFEPFFTTKELGKGSGLGLSMVQGMATQSGGGVHIASTVGGGTTITLYLPAVPLPRGAGADEPAEPDGGAEQTILVVEDDPLVRLGTVALIEELGYRVVEAGGGAEALAILRSGRPVDALVTDFAMPDMNGADLIREARRLLPGLPALVVTGYAEMRKPDPSIRILHKPFSRKQLSACLTALLQD